MSINWQDLRALNGSQHTAFEELSCQLAAAEQVPPDSQFRRKGAPDAGVECYWKLPDGTEWGWQAKYFLSPPDDGQWGQIDKSVKTALEKHPRLSRFVVCLPIDRQDPRIPNQRWFMDKWDERVQLWEEWATAKGMAVVFEYWGAHEFLVRLSHEEHRGRYYFWFHRDLFSQEWFQSRIEEAIANVGPRYSPELDVQLPIARLFHGLGRTPEFFARVKGYIREIKKAVPYRTDTPSPDQTYRLDSSLRRLWELIGALDPHDVTRIDWEGALTAIQTAMEVSQENAETLSTQAEVEEKEPDAKERKEAIDRLKYLSSAYWRLHRELRELAEYIDEDEVRLSNLPALLMVAEAGRGKTHLFCDIARQRLQMNAPTVLLIGGQLNLDEPWTQIIRLLGLACTKEEFVGALEAAAQATGSRALILIDALNEGQGKSLWKKHLAGILLTLSKSPWLSIAVSVRTSYEETIVPEGITPSRLIRAVHHGFAQHEYEATKTFFDYFGIQRPSVPLLVPEFQNPLFLKIFCKGLENNDLTSIPPGLQGITAIFQFFIESVNKKLADAEYLNFNPRLNIVWRAVTTLAQKLAQAGADWLPVEDAQDIINRVLPREGYEQSLYRHLLAEGVIAENRFYLGDHEWGEGVQFAYERFTDHLVGKYLLDTHLDDADPASSFATGAPLAVYVEDHRACVIHQGLIEAFSIQLPERVKKELIELIPGLRAYHTVTKAFIDSIVWRDPKRLNMDVATDYINSQIIHIGYQHERLLNALLTVAVNPDHPLNADFLHRNLVRQELAERDAWWSIFLHHEYGNHDAVDRLVDWAWSPEDKAHIVDEPLRLCGVALAWFLTTSNRFLRDRTTKALVRLFSHRIPVLRSILETFIGVNDPYVLERLMAVAYGCALRSEDNETTRLLALDVYRWIFSDGTPPVHILLRDYARGVIEVALHRGLELDIDVTKTQPPYESTFPDSIPSEEELKQKYNNFGAEKRDIDRAQSWLWFSVMGWDFARYVIGTNVDSFHWSSQRLREPRQPTRKERFEAFAAILTQRQKRALAQYQTIRNNVAFCRRLDPKQRQEEFDVEFTDEQLDEALSAADEWVRQKLGKKKTVLLTDDIIHYIDNPREDEFRFNLSLAQQWIIQRVFELGWSVEKFGSFDSTVNYHDVRDAHKPERIGKKYQWIAYHEFLARAADNLVFRGERYSEPREEPYQGPWQGLSVRDIDPSWVPSRTQRTSGWHGFSPTWWASIRMEWSEDLTDRAWVRTNADLPTIESLIRVTNPNNAVEWMALEGSYRWEHPQDTNDDDTLYPRRSLSYYLQSYLVKETDVEEVYTWIKTQWQVAKNFHLPDSHDLYRVFLGEYFWAPAYIYHNVPYYGHDDWIGGEEGERIPRPILVTTDQYTQESNGFDCSVDDSIHVYLPCKWIVDEMDLCWRGVEAHFYDSAGNLIAFDPSVKTKGPGALLINRALFLKYLKGSGYTLLWVVTGEKIIITGSFPETDWLGRLNILGMYRLQDDNIRGELHTKLSE